MTNELERTDFQKLFDASPGLRIVLRPDFTVVAASDAYLHAARMHRSKLVGKHFFDVIPDVPELSLRASFERVLRERVADTMPTHVYGADMRHWGATNLPVLTPNGEVAYIVRSVEDMTKTVLEEGERKTLEKERDLFFAHSYDLLGIVGADGYFKRTNPAFERVMGYSESELRSQPLVEFLHADDVKKTQSGMETLSSGFSRRSSVNRYRCKDGTYKWISWNTSPMGELFFTAGRDITDQVNAEERIQQLNSELARKNEELERKVEERLAELQRSEAQVQQLQKMDAIGRLAGGIAHDFNNILGALSIFCDLISDDLDKPQVVGAHVEDIRQVVGRAAALTRQLLVFSRKQIVQLQTVSLNPLIQQMERMLMRLIGENIKIATHLPAELRPVRVDPSQMEQVILNLVVNAKDAMPNGGTITLETSNIYLDENFTGTHLEVTPGHYVLFSVSDNGTGMDADTLSKVFEPFFTTKPVGKGTGLGLTTTYGIVKQYQGTIWAYSEPGEGTVFKIYLPVAEKIAEPAKSAPAAPLGEPGNQTILLVEDDDKLRHGFSAMLRKKGYQVLEAPGERWALEICEHHAGPIQLLLTDVVMPGASGFEIAKKISVLRGDIRVLYMSGYTSDALENSGMESAAGLNFIQKPFDTNALILKVQEVLSSGSRDAVAFD